VPRHGAARVVLKSCKSTCWRASAQRKIMKSSIQLIATLAAVLLSPNVFANADLAMKKNCMACHALDKKLVGPAYKAVAAKYANDKDAVTRLAEKIVNGGSGVWGPVPMPANAQVNPAEAKQLAQWVLTVK